MNRRELTARETAVAALVGQGRTNSEIAEILGVSLATAKRHLNNIMIKWNCANRTQVAVEAMRRGEMAAMRSPDEEMSVQGEKSAPRFDDAVAARRAS